VFTFSELLALQTLTIPLKSHVQENGGTLLNEALTTELGNQETDQGVRDRCDDPFRERRGCVQRGTKKETTEVRLSESGAEERADGW